MINNYKVLFSSQFEDETHMDYWQLQHFHFVIFFVVAKPLVVDGTTKSHALSLAYDQVSLSELDPPLVL